VAPLLGTGYDLDYENAKAEIERDKELFEKEYGHGFLE